MDLLVYLFYLFSQGIVGFPPLQRLILNSVLPKVCVPLHPLCHRCLYLPCRLGVPRLKVNGRQCHHLMCFNWSSGCRRRPCLTVKRLHREHSISNSAAALRPWLVLYLVLQYEKLGLVTRRSGLILHVDVDVGEFVALIWLFLCFFCRQDLAVFVGNLETVEFVLELHLGTIGVEGDQANILQFILKVLGLSHCPLIDFGCRDIWICFLEDPLGKVLLKTISQLWVDHLVIVIELPGVSNGCLHNLKRHVTVQVVVGQGLRLALLYPRVNVVFDDLVRRKLVGVWRVCLQHLIDT